MGWFSCNQRAETWVSRQPVFEPVRGALHVLKRKMMYLVFAFFGTEAFYGEEQLIDGLPFGHLIAD